MRKANSLAVLGVALVLSEFSVVRADEIADRIDGVTGEMAATLERGRDISFGQIRIAERALELGREVVGLLRSDSIEGVAGIVSELEGLQADIEKSNLELARLLENQDALRDDLVRLQGIQQEQGGADLNDKEMVRSLVAKAERMKKASQEMDVNADRLEELRMQLPLTEMWQELERLLMQETDPARDDQLEELRLALERLS